jgi:uncharacterized RDD family membrane protein YckC
MQSITTEGLINRQELIKEIIQPARQRKRFFNYLIDITFYYMIMVMMGVIWGGILIATGGSFEESDSENMIWNIIAIGGFLAYYITFESILGKTIGKMVTNTKVVLTDGTKPALKKIVIRTFSRLIPFEAFSFLSGPLGWHDSISGTMVIDDISLYRVGSKTVDQSKMENEY